MCTQTTFQTRGTRLIQQAHLHQLLSLKVVIPQKGATRKYPFLGMDIIFLYQ